MTGTPPSSTSEPVGNSPGTPFNSRSTSTPSPKPCQSASATPGCPARSSIPHASLASPGAPCPVSSSTSSARPSAASPPLTRPSRRPASRSVASATSRSPIARRESTKAPKRTNQPPTTSESNRGDHNAPSPNRTTTGGSTPATFSFSVATIHAHRLTRSNQSRCRRIGQTRKNSPFHWDIWYHWPNCQNRISTPSPNRVSKDHDRIPNLPLREIHPHSGSDLQHVPKQLRERIRPNTRCPIMYAPPAGR